MLGHMVPTQRKSMRRQEEKKSQKQFESVSKKLPTRVNCIPYYGMIVLIILPVMLYLWTHQVSSLGARHRLNHGKLTVSES